MSLASVFDVAGNGMNAQSTRLSTMASNIASIETVSSSVDKIYRARHPVFSTMFQQAQGDGGLLFADQDNSGTGVQMLDIIENQSSLMPRYESNHPATGANGYVYYPSVNVVEEVTNMIFASRAFQANTEMMNTAKQVMQKILTLGQ